MMVKLNTRNNEGALFVLQWSSSVPRTNGSAQTGAVSSFMMCVTAITTVATEVPRTPVP